jgi:4a-hydroxytetrahydrobiopterin dehydratase
MDTKNQLPKGWVIKQNYLVKRFEFKGFKNTMFFVNAVAWEANLYMHHPDMQVGFNYCEIQLTTHDNKNQLTEKDYQMAKAIENLF